MKRLLVLASLLVLAACGDRSGLPSAQTRSPDGADHPQVYYSADGARIYWWQQEGDRWHLWMSPADMSAPQRLPLATRAWDTNLLWSPDGSRFVVEANTNTAFPVLWLVPGAGGEPRRITAGERLEEAIAWHPDGRRLAYLTVVEQNVRTMVVDVDSGAPMRLLPDESRPHVGIWSPDGARLAIQVFGQGRSTIWLADGAGGGRRQVTTDGFENLAGPKPWAPDGSAVLYVSRRTGTSDVWLQPADGSPARQLTNDVRDDDSPFWSPDGRWVAFRSNRGLQNDLWVVPAAGGPARRVTDDKENEVLRGWRPGTTELAYVVRRNRSALWAYALADSTERRLTDDSLEIGAWNVSSTGQIALTISHGGGVRDIAVLPLGGGEPRTILRDAKSSGLMWSPDGTKLVFSSTRAGANPDIWVMGADGGDLRRLTDWPEPENPSNVFSADGSALYFQSNHEARWGDVWRVPLSGGDPTQITNSGRVLGICSQLRPRSEVLVGVVAESPVTVALARVGPRGALQPVWDRTTAACGFVSPTADSVVLSAAVADGAVQSMLLPLGGGPGRALLEPNQVARRWSPDGRQLLFTYSSGTPFDYGILNVAGGSTRRVTNTTANEGGAEWSADGSTIVFSRSVVDARITTADVRRLLARRE